ncbi:MAG: hypothetical protein QOD11_2971 [Bradyrhizobium sp.]|jgi:hypothetical protein|nr:hypothetical protein [Bradyrhizobium sp.]
MRIWIATMTLMALLAIGDAGTINIASAAKVITVPQRTQFAPAPTHRATRQDRTGYGPYDDSRYDHSRYDHSRYDRSPYDHSAYDRSYDGGWTYYYGRPYFYAPAPFPLGFDFGFGW